MSYNSFFSKNGTKSLTQAITTIFLLASILIFVPVFTCLVPNDHFELPDIYDFYQGITEDIENTIAFIKISAAHEETYSREIKRKRFAYSWDIEAKKTKTQPLTIAITCDDVSLENSLKRSAALGPLIHSSNKR